MKNYPAFETERLILRPTDKDDAVFILGLFNSPKWLQNIGDRRMYDLAQAEQYIAERMMPQIKRLGFGNFTLIRKIDGAKIGTCGLYDRKGLEGVDIGYALLEAYEGQGYASEAAQKLMVLAEQEWKLSTVQGITLESNQASRNLLEKLGLTFVEYISLPNESKELMLYRCTFAANS